MLLPLRIIEVQRLGATAASITFSAISTKIPVGSRHLVLLQNAHLDGAFTFTDSNVTFNGDTGANYNIQQIVGGGAVATAFRVTNNLFVAAFRVTGDSLNASAFSGGIMVLPNALNAISNKTFACFAGATDQEVRANAGHWDNLAAIESINIVPNVAQFDIGSIFALAVVDERYLIEEDDLTIDGVVNFANIPAGSGDLALIGNVRSDVAALSDSFNNEINGDAVDANYLRENLGGVGAVISHTSAIAQRNIFSIVGNTAAANIFAPIVFNYYQHGRNQNFPHVLGIAGFHASGASSGMNVTSFRRNNIAPITSLDLSPRTGTNFKAGSLVGLYHVPNRARLFDRRVLDAAQGNIDFNGIPLVFDTDVPLALQLYLYGRSNVVATSDTSDIFFNGDFVNGNYLAQQLQGNAGAIIASQFASATLDFLSGSTQPANVFSGGAHYFLGFAETDRHKDRLAMSGNAQDRVFLLSGRWSDVTPIDDIRAVLSTGPLYDAESVAELEMVVDPTVDTLHLTFGSSLISQTFNVNYPGTWKTFPRIIIVGPLDNFRIDNLTTGEHIELTFNIPPGRTVTIDLRSGRKTVVDDLGTNLIGTVTADSQLGTFHIAAAPEAPLGVNQFRITGVSAEEGTSQVTLEWLNRYYGI